MLKFSSVSSYGLRHSDYRFLITGASGWLGRSLLEMLVGVFGAEVSDRVILCGSTPRTLTCGQGWVLPIHTIADGFALLGKKLALVFHFAFLTKDQVGNMAEQTYIESNRSIADNVAAGIAAHRVIGVMMASSGAVYDHFATAQRDAAANLYGMLKAEDEQRFAAACTEVGARFIAPRIFNISGPHINKFSAYALSSIIVDALQGAPITLQANRPVYRSYLHVGDVLELSLRYLLDETEVLPEPFFDTVGDEVVEVGELACKVLEVLDCRHLPINRPPLLDGVENRYVGDPVKLRELLRLYEFELIPLTEQILSTATYIQQTLHLQHG